MTPLGKWLFPRKTTVVQKGAEDEQQLDAVTTPAAAGL